MIRDTRAGVGFARSWLSGRADVVARELELDRGDRSVPATLLLPARARRGPLPGWIMLHGATVPGREHAQLVRFSRSVAHTGAAVVVPEVPEWRALRLAPGLTAPTVRAALPALRAQPEVAGAPLGLIGFSFGAPHAVAAAAEPDIAAALRLVVGFGAYCDLPRTLRFLFLGEHEWRGERHRTTPDPYGRWIVAGNYLSHVPGYQDAGDVARALLALAAEAGARGLPSGDPVYDPLKRELAEGVAPARRGLFERIAPPGGRASDGAEIEALLAAMPDAIRRVDPEMDPAPRLARVRTPVRLVHGHGDTLIPYTETLRMAERMEGQRVRAMVTRLFAHTREDPPLAGVRLIVEQARFVRTVGAVLRMG